MTDALPILVVNDEIGLLTFMRIFLERAGFQVKLAHDGKEALALLEKESFLMVIVDKMMPGMDGFELTRIIRADKKTCDIPILFAAGGLPEIIQEALEAGANDFLNVPLDPNDFLIKVRRLVAGSDPSGGILRE